MPFISLLIQTPKSEIADHAKNYNHISIPTWVYRKKSTMLHLIYTVYIVS